MNKSMVSIIIATKNYGEWILQAISSVIKQDYPHQNLKIVVCDDGSTDGTIELFRNYFDVFHNGQYRGKINDVELHYLRFDISVGVSEARNAGMRAVWDQTDIFQILDADDMLEPTRISKGITALSESDLICAAYSDYLILNDDGTKTYESKQPYDRAALMRSCIIHSGCTIKKSALEKVGLYDPEINLGEDLDLWLRLSDYFSFTHIAEPLVIVRNHSRNSTNSNSQAVWRQNMQKIQDKCAARYG